jgi:hypothetical protein
MANTKISNLTGASTPLGGTEVLPIVQGGATVKVSVANLTAGRAVSASTLTASGMTVAGVVTNNASGLFATNASLATSLGGTGLSGATPFTANGVIYASSTSALATGSGLTWDGTNLNVGTANAYFQLNSTANNGNISVLSSAANANFNLASKGAGSINFNATGGFYCTQIYSTPVGGTNRVVYSDNAGTIGYLSSVRASKTNINYETDFSWLKQLKPVSFNYRKKIISEDKQISYADESDGGLQYGLIAEDVELVNKELCIYDMVDGEPKLVGISYEKLILPLLQQIQELQNKFDAYVAAHP